MWKNNFSQGVYQIVKKIPKGKVATYSQIAKILGNAKATRAVGLALNRNLRPIIIPCHRVISSDGSLGGYVTGLLVKTKLLKKEGIKIKNGKIDLTRYGWRT